MTVRKISTKRAGPPVRQVSKQIKQYTIGPCNAESNGKKIIVYSDTGMGKSTLAALAPQPVFLSLDKGIEELKHPLTGERLIRVEQELEIFQDVRDVLGNLSLFNDRDTVVVDTVTILQDLAEVHVVQTIPTEKGIKVKNITGYGYNKGYKHLYNTMKLILQDCDALIHQGKNVILIAQAAIHNIPNPSGEDFLRAGPRLHKDKSWDIEALFCEWADHIFRIDYQDVFVKEKKVTGETTRMIYTKPEVYFRAKSRTLTEPLITFENPQDDSLWHFMFPELYSSERGE